MQRRKKGKKGNSNLVVLLAILIIAGTVGGLYGYIKKRPVRVNTTETAIYLPGISPEEEEEEEEEEVISDFSGIIPDGIHIGNIDVSGMTAEEAETAVNSYINEVCTGSVTFIAPGDHEVSVQLSELQPYWENEDVLNNLVGNVTDGDLIERYKWLKDIEYSGMELPLDVSFDKTVVTDFLQSQCSIYDTELINPTLKRENGEFIVVDGQDGIRVNIGESSATILNTVFNKYLDGQREFVLDKEELYAEGAADELAMVHDLLGSYTTSYSSSGTNRSNNVANGCRLINGTTLYPGEEFSAYSAVSPFTTENGFYLAGSYLQGKVVESIGGGICQVSSTLYNAVLRAELQVTQRHNHSMVVNYVDKSADAAIAESAGKDFCFINNTEHPIYIEGYTEGKRITFNIYGVETRPASHRVEFESVIISETQPTYESIIADAGQGIGYVSVQSAHIGYKAELWKIVYENGVEISREKINESVYTMTPRTAVVGIGSPNPEYTAMMQNAIASGSIDVCKQTAADIQAYDAALQAIAQQQQLEYTEVTVEQSDAVAP